MSGPKIEPRVPRGMRDILPELMIPREYVTGVIRQTFEQFGFEPLQTPAIELEETLTGKYGPDADRLMYKVGHDRGKEDLALRYDLTVSLCRVIAQYPDLSKPFRRYQIAPVWRAERPQKGRFREFFQCDVDTVGSASVLADAEILNVIYTILVRLGFKQFVMTVNDRKLLRGSGPVRRRARRAIGRAVPLHRQAGPGRPGRRGEGAAQERDRGGGDRPAARSVADQGTESCDPQQSSSACWPLSRGPGGHRRAA